MDIVALCPCLQPHVTAPILRQCLRMALAMLVMTGRARCEAFAGGPEKGAVSVPCNAFAPQRSRGQYCLGCSFVSMCTVPRMSTCWLAMKS